MHELIIERGEASMFVRVRCRRDGCPLCASTAEQRARITFVKAQTKR